MKFRDILQRFKVRRRISMSEVSFESFYNDSSFEKSAVKESSLNNEINKLSPAKLNNTSQYEYTAYARHPQPFPLPLKLIVAFILFITFCILPVIYLCHVYGIIHPKNVHSFYSEVKQAAHYEPSEIVHQVFQSVSHGEQKNDIVKSLPPPPKPDYNQCKLLPEPSRFDCFPDSRTNQESCEERGCCWIPAKTKPSRKNTLDTPYCFFPPNYNTYVFVNSTETAFGMIIFMKRSYKTFISEDIELLKVIVKYETDTRLHIKIVDPEKNRFETPYPELPIVDRSARHTLYKFNINPLESNGFEVVRKSDNTTIFDSNNFINFIYSDQFLQISTKLPSKNIYGIGEHRSNLLLSTKWSKYTLFNHDAIPSFGRNLYGSHPFYMVIENTTNTHGVFLLNSNAMDIIIQPTPAITFRTIGGILDFYYFLGPTPKDVIQQYTELVGFPQMPPYWGLGFHLCRFGYKTLNRTKIIMERNIAAGIPIDTQWNDLDYMDNSNDFTYDRANFKGLPEFVKSLHQRGMHYIPLVDPGVSASEKPGTYPPYDVGIQMGIFVKNSTNQPFIGKVWNRASTVWPDFTHPTTVDYWTQMLRNFHEKVPFDGVWIDMNEPSNFLSGSFNGCPKTSLDNPPYMPGIDGGVINYKTMCMSAKHYAGLHYDVHNLYGLTEAIVTNFAMAEIRGKRPMIISRSTFPGHGHYAGHWSGDVVSDWLDMRYSIPQLLSFSMFGIPLMGADICGFNKNTTKPLCNRWMQLGAFYPFSRNHNTDNGIDQDPAAFGEEVINSSKKALSIRYALLPYLYTLFWRAHTNGETVARPLFVEFNKDEKTYGIDTQFMWGPSIMILPVLNEHDVFVNAYLPSGVWYDYSTKMPVYSRGQNFNISAPLDTIPVFIRGGSIIPQQGSKQTTTASRKTPFHILAALDKFGKAVGELYWDDGDSLNSYEENKYSLISFKLKNQTLNVAKEEWQADFPPNLGTITILGIEKLVYNVRVNGVSQQFSYDTTSKSLVIRNMNLSFDKSISVVWKTK